MVDKTSWIFRISAAASLLAALIFLFGIAGWFLPMPDNWLMVIFKLLADWPGTQLEMLYRLNGLDIFILFLTGLTHIGLYLALRKIGKLVALFALVQPFIGIVIFVITKSAGRSALMGAALLISLVMLRSNSFSRWMAITGIAAGLLLWAGDLSVSSAYSLPMTILFGIGYALYILWLFDISNRLFRLKLAADEPETESA